MMKIFHYFSSNNPLKIDLCLEKLGITDLEEKDKQIVLDEISKYIFNIHSNQSGEKVFDFEQDYKYYFCDFFKLGINLNKDEIDWWEFDSLLEGFMLDENSTISRVIGFRTYKKPSKSIKTQEAEEHKYRMRMKQKYSLKIPIKNVDGGLEKMWSYLEKKVGDSKEC